MLGISQRNQLAWFNPHGKISGTIAPNGAIINTNRQIDVQMVWAEPLRVPTPCLPSQCGQPGGPRSADDG